VGLPLRGVQHFPCFKCFLLSSKIHIRSTAGNPMNYIQETYKIPCRVQEIRFTVRQFSVAGDLLLPLTGAKHPLIILVWGDGEAGRHMVGKPSRMLNRFVEQGYAVFLEDKPGFGASTGEFSRDSLLHERAMILAEEAAILRKHAEIHPDRVGVYGHSQGGYVIALAMEGGCRFDFVIAISCPAMNGVSQSAYLVGKQILCEGLSKEVAQEAESYYAQRESAQDYPTYLEAARYLDGIPLVRDVLGWGGIIPEEEFTPRQPDWEDFYDPMSQFSKLTMPALVIFGEKDTQANPVQGSAAYQKAFEQNGNRFFQVVNLKDTDHNMEITETGCWKEQVENYQRGGGKGANPEFLRTLSKWLGLLKEHF
jgi:pimeloyl-ACP methyl ester carboxylesterase